MPAIDYDYDPHMVLSANEISEEEHNLTDRGIFPLHGPFYKEGHLLEGFDGASWVPLTLGEDYVFSPSFLSISAATGKEAFTYFVYVGDLADYSMVRITYHAVGKYEDVPLLLKVTELSPTERGQVYSWMKLRNVVAYDVPTRNPELENKSILEVINIGLEQVNTSLEELAGLDTASIIQRLEALEAQVS